MKGNGFMAEKIKSILDFSIGSFTVGKIVSALVTFIVCYVVIRVLNRLIAKLIEKTSIDNTLKRYLKTAVKVVLYFITAMIVVDALGISATSLVAAFSVVGLAASLAVQDSLSNIASGIMLIINKPFVNGDYIEVEDISGTVSAVSLVHTKVVTIDNKMIFVPNSKVVSAKITNFTSEDKRRVDIEVSASYDSPVNDVRNALLNAVKRSELFIDEPEAPFAAVLSYDDSSIKYVVRAWTETAEYWNAYFALMENIKASFDDSGIKMTYNHINVHMIDDNN